MHADIILNRTHTHTETHTHTLASGRSRCAAQVSTSFAVQCKPGNDFFFSCLRVVCSLLVARLRILVYVGGQIVCDACTPAAVAYVCGDDNLRGRCKKKAHKRRAYFERIWVVLFVCLIAPPRCMCGCFVCVYGRVRTRLPPTQCNHNNLSG